MKRRQKQNCGIGIGGPTHHPLLMTHIAAEVISYLSFTQLKTCRQVCRDWKIAGAKYFRNKAVVVIDSERRLEELLSLFTEETYPGFKNFKFTNSDISPKSVLLDQFLTGFGGSYLKCVHFENYNFTLDNVSHQFNILDKIPGVEEIILDCREMPLGRINPDMPALRYPNLKIVRCAFAFRNVPPDNDMRDMDGFAQTMMKLLCLSPNIETVSTFLKSERKRRINYPLELYLPNRNLLFPPILQRPENSTNADFLMGLILGTIAGTHPTDMLQNFTHLDMNLLRREHILEIKSLPLKAMNFVFTDSRFPQEDAAVVIPANIEAVKEFFTNPSRNKLETLRVTIARNEQVAQYIEIYDLSSLKKLALHGGTSTPHFYFMRGCPRLETLHLAQCVLPREIDEIISNVNIPNLQTLVTHDVKIRGRVTSPHILATKISTEFLHLRKLKIDQLRDPGFSLICKRLVQLEELIILKSNLTDYGVTGLSKVILKKLGGRVGNEIANKSRNRPYIGSLKNLRRLEIGSPTLSDASVLYGILDCASLKSLTIFCPKLSGKGLRNIVDKMDLLALRTICCYEVPDSALKYACVKLGDPENVILNLEKGPKSSAQKAEVIEKYSLGHLYMTLTD